jgi:hypothetical protein
MDLLRRLRAGTRGRMRERLSDPILSLHSDRGFPVACGEKTSQVGDECRRGNTELVVTSSRHTAATSAAIWSQANQSTG